MINLHLSQYKAFSALRRMTINLLNKGELTSENMDKLYYLGSERGFCKESIQEIVLDCQIEYCIE